MVREKERSKEDKQAFFNLSVKLYARNLHAWSFITGKGNFSLTLRKLPVLKAHRLLINQQSQPFPDLTYICLYKPVCLYKTLYKYFEKKLIVIIFLMSPKGKTLQLLKVWPIHKCMIFKRTLLHSSDLCFLLLMNNQSNISILQIHIKIHLVKISILSQKSVPKVTKWPTVCTFSTIKSSIRVP